MIVLYVVAILIIIWVGIGIVAVWKESRHWEKGYFIPPVVSASMMFSRTWNSEIKKEKKGRVVKVL